MMKEKITVNEVINNNYTKINNYFKIKIKNQVDAEDVAHNYWIHIFNKYDTHYKENSQLSNWLTRIASNHIADYHRVNNKLSMLTSELNDQKNHISYDYDNNDHLNYQFKIVSNIIKKLDPHQAFVLNYYYISGLTHKEISEKYNINLNTVLGRHRYALINIRKHLNLPQL